MHTLRYFYVDLLFKRTIQEGVLHVQFPNEVLNQDLESHKNPESCVFGHGRKHLVVIHALLLAEPIRHESCEMLRHIPVRVMLSMKHQIGLDILLLSREKSEGLFPIFWIILTS